jgi:hemin uptake protein HemP
MNEPQPPSTESKPLSTGSGVETAKRAAWTSEELLGDHTEVQIVHNNEVYRLRRTRQGKLILYK